MPEDDDYCGGEPTKWRTRFRSWLCDVHFREYVERADYVAEQRTKGGSIRVTW